MKNRLAAWLLLAVLGAPARGQDNPPRLAASGRFDLTGSVGVGALTNGQLLAGGGSFTRQTWLPADQQPRTYSVDPDIVHFAWTELAFRFTPMSNGTVTLSLMGPWEQSPSNGLIYRQEVYWDACTASNAALPNGSFETVTNGVPAGWTRPWGDGTAVTGPVAAVNGSRCARTWHDGALQCTLAVTGGAPVLFRCFARAVFPSNLTDMARIAASNTPAHRAATNFMRGVNLGNYLEAPPGQDWGAAYSNADFVRIRAEGFDHVRLPIGWHYHTGAAPDYTLSNGIVAQADFLVTNALRAGLGAIVNIHHFNEFTAAPAAWSNKFFALWRQIAALYSNAPPAVAFELLNEPNGAATTEVMNPIYAEAIRQIRLSNPGRVVFVGPGNYNGIADLGRLRLPDADSNLIVTVHCYEPFLFTHQGASWTLPATATRGVVYPGPPATPLAPDPLVTHSGWVVSWFEQYNVQPAGFNPSGPRAFADRLAQARQWSDAYGRPVHLGEFGCYVEADAASRARFYTDFRGRADALGLGWAMWDWKAGFRYWDNASGQPAPGMRSALFPAPLLRTDAPGRVLFDAAVSQTYAVEQTTNLLSAGAWAPVATQTLTQPLFQYTDPAPTQPAAFYRVQRLK